MIKDFYFKDDRLWKYMQNIQDQSKELISELIEKYSPIQIGEDVEAQSFGDGTEMMRVTKIDLMAADSFGFPGERLSFYYEGVPLSKKGEPMKNRKPKWFGGFKKDGKWYWVPSYRRVKIIPAMMH